MPFASSIFTAPRNLRVLLPAGYRLPVNRTRHYPVVYLNGGQNLEECANEHLVPGFEINHRPPEIKGRLPKHTGQKRARRHPAITHRIDSTVPSGPKARPEEARVARADRSPCTGSRFEGKCGAVRVSQAYRASKTIQGK